MNDINYRLAAECAMAKHLITRVYPTGICSLVSDTFDFWGVLTKVVPILHDDIKARKPITDEEGNVSVPGRTVFRPDSGCPVKILTGYKVYYPVDECAGELDMAWNNGFEAVKINDSFFKIEPYVEGGENRVRIGKELSEPEVKGAVEVLWDIFGGSFTDRGFKMLDDCVGLIYGDSITLERAEAILERLGAKGFASSNVVLGIGSYTYQYVTRDSFGWAVKATAGVVDGEVRELMKDPATDDGTKKSAKGYLRVEKEGDDFVLYDQQTWEQAQEGELKTVFLNGELTNKTTFSQVRDTLAKNL